MKEKSFLFYMLAVIVFLFPFCVGGYLIFYCCLVSVIMAMGLSAYVIREKNINISYSIGAVVFALICVMYLITKLWAVDKSMSFEGFVRFLAPALFMLCVVQIDSDDRTSLLDMIPFSAGAMTIMSYSLGQINKSLHSRFFDNVGDLHGAFQYANAYAIFLLVGIIIALTRDYNSVKQRIVYYITVLVNALGLTLTGSRAVQLLTIGIVGIVILKAIYQRIDNKKGRIALISIVAVLGIISIILAISLGLLSKAWNYVSTDGPMVERSLYYVDAIRYILHHLFGKGAYAFYFLEPQIQSASYYVIDLHNDYLQMAMEIGVIPALAFIAMLVYQFISKNNSFTQKMIILALMLHCIIDYDLQFTFFWFVLILCMDLSKFKDIEIKSNLIVFIFAVAVIAINTVIGLSNYYNYSGHHQKSIYYYKNTPSMIVMMMANNDQQFGYDIANEILDKNDNAFEANSVLSSIFAANEKYDEAIYQMELALKKNPRDMDCYKQYIDLLVEAHDYYVDNDEKKLADECVKKIIDIPNTLKALEESTPERAKKYGRKQSFTVGKKYNKIIKKYKKART